MKRICTLLAVCLAISSSLFAQDEKLAPGIYSIVDGTATPLLYSPGITHNSGVNVIGVEIGKSSVTFKGETAGVTVTDKIVMVIDPERKAMVRSPKRYDAFIKSMTPDLILIVPLQVAKKKRIYDGGTSFQGFNTNKLPRVEFEWELIDENTFEIRADFQPGEYAVVFKPAKLGAYDFSGIYGFCVKEAPTETSVETPAETPAEAPAEAPVATAE